MTPSSTKPLNLHHLPIPVFPVPNWPVRGNRLSHYRKLVRDCSDVASKAGVNLDIGFVVKTSQFPVKGTGACLCPCISYDKRNDRLCLTTIKVPGPERPFCGCQPREITLIYKLKLFFHARRSTWLNFSYWQELFSVFTMKPFVDVSLHSMGSLLRACCCVVVCPLL